MIDLTALSAGEHRHTLSSVDLFVRHPGPTFEARCSALDCGLPVAFPKPPVAPKPARPWWQRRAAQRALDDLADYLAERAENARAGETRDTEPRFTGGDEWRLTARTATKAATLVNRRAARRALKRVATHCYQSAGNVDGDPHIGRKPIYTPAEAYEGAAQYVRRCATDELLLPWLAWRLTFARLALGNLCRGLRRR